MISRQELYGLVWSEPMTKVAARFAVSGSYLARICTLLSVPRPERGHWAKVAVGRGEPAPLLPEALAGTPEYWTRDGEPQPVASRPLRVRTPSTPKRRIPEGHVHRLIRDGREHFLRSRRVEDGAHLKPYKKLLVDVVTSKACLEQALSLANDLFNCLESLGHQVVIAHGGVSLRHAELDEREVRSKPRGQYDQSGLWYPARPTVAYVGEIAVGLSIVEMSEEALVRYVGGEYVRESEHFAKGKARGAGYTWTTTREIPSGRFRIIAYCPYPGVTWSAEWQDTADASLRGKLGSIAKAIGRAAPMLVGKIEEADKQAEIRRQEWLADQDRFRREQDRRAVEQSIRASKEHLVAVIEQWSKAMSVERFLTSVESKVAELPETEREAAIERLRLARHFLGPQDPLRHFLQWLTPEELYKPVYPDAALAMPVGPRLDAVLEQ
jgi:hypothetical protein